VGTAEDASKLGARGDADLVTAVPVNLRRVAVVANQGGEVLMQGAAECDVHDLQAAADAEHREPGRDRPASALDLGVGARRVGRIGKRIAGGTVPGRVDIAASG